MREKILITGGAGYVGSVLVPILLEKGYYIRVIDNLMYGVSSLLSCFINKNFEFIKGDITSKEVIQNVLKDIDFIIHLAAIVGYPACKLNPKLAKRVNIDGTRNILEKKRKDQLLIYSSTGSNYGIVKDRICTEETPLNPISVYGKTKTEAEELIAISDNFITFRFATAFGLSPRLRLDLLINDFVNMALRRKEIILYERFFKRTFIHVRDMAKAFIFAIENADRLKGETFNVGSENMNYTKEEIANIIKNKISYYLHFAEIGEDEDKRNYEVSYKKINKLGYFTGITMEEGIDELIKGLKMINIPTYYSNADLTFYV